MNLIEKRIAKSAGKLSTCHPILQNVGSKFHLDLTTFLNLTYPDKNYLVEWTDGYRDPEFQKELVRLGRSKAPPGMSLHNYGLALDFAIFDPGYGLYDWFEKCPSFWTYVKDLTYALGLHWGGNWKTFVDKPHVSLTLGFASEKECCLWLLSVPEKERALKIEERYESKRHATPRQEDLSGGVSKIH